MMTAMVVRSAIPRARLLVVLALLALGALVAWPQAGEAAVGPPTKKLSWSARVLAPTAVRRQPSHRSKAIGVLRTTAPFGGGPMVLLVLERRIVGGQEWIRLLLPRRPNGISGWVVSDVLRFRANPMRIVIDQSERITYVYRKGRLVLKLRNAIGKAATPTPFGRFAVAEKIATPARGFLGPMVLVTTGFSEKLNEYAGGNGRFALHGTSLPALIGTRASHGCIRHRNAAIKRISYIVSVGTPIIIRP